MEGTPLPYHNSGNSKKLNYDRNISSPSSASKNEKHHRHNHTDPPASGQVVFRLLCHAYTAGGVIGRSGSIIKHLETLTGSKIRFEEGQPNCHERVINIIGDSALERKISVENDEEANVVDVSKAQEALVRVFERVLEVKGTVGNNENENGNDHNNNNGRTDNEFVGCRLLAPRAQIGSLMGKKGKIVDGIRKRSGAKVKILKKDKMPACAGPDEELVQIMGGTVAVKKALLAVSHLLQCRTNGAGTTEQVSLHEASDIVHLGSSPKVGPKNLSCSKSTAKNGSGDSSLSVDVERILNLDEDSSQREVVFRLLCSNAIAGGVLGKGAGIVKSLEKETGASIKFAAPVSGLKERVATISSLENSDPSCSPAQVAVVRVFERCMEVGQDRGLITSLSDWDSVDARIVIVLSQLDCLLDEYGRVALDISIDLGVDLQLHGADNIPNSATDTKVLQITGDFGSVKSALFRVTGRLRESFFSGTGCRHNLSSTAITSSSPYRREADPLTQSPHASKLSHITDHGFVKQPSSWNIQEQANSRDSIPTPVDTAAQGLKTSRRGRKPISGSSKEKAKQTVEVVVPQKLFESIYGENGSNLARLKEISGATVVMQDPSPGESNGKVIISATADRIQIAQSLLQAFISF